MSGPTDRLRRALAACPVAAILRGITPVEALAVGEALTEAGLSLIEVPLNSPEPFESLARLRRALDGRAIVGAGTVLKVADVARVRDAGGELVVSPNTDRDVIAAAVEAGLISLPGYLTPSEAFAALAAGAHGLKLFPAESASPAVLRAHRAVLPATALVLAVGGIRPETVAPWREAGADGFGVGSNIYAPGRPAAETGRRARAFVEAARVS